MPDDTQQQPALALTAAERAEIRDEHYQLPIEGSCAGCTYGDGRGSELGWPCPTIRLLDALEAAQEQAEDRLLLANDLERERDALMVRLESAEAIADKVIAERAEARRERNQARATRDALAREVGALRAALAAPSAGGEDGRS